jgi:hypothetical protein
MAKQTNKEKKTEILKAAVTRPYPRRPLQDALRVPIALKERNGGNPWSPEELAQALDFSSKNNNNFFYLTAASRDFGLTEGTRDSKQISLTDFGHSLVYAPNKQQEEQLLRRAFLNVDIFRRLLEYYKGSDLPEMKYLSNTLQKEFELHPDTHEEFIQLFRDNTKFLGIGAGY